MAIFCGCLVVIILSIVSPGYRNAAFGAIKDIALNGVGGANATAGAVVVIITFLIGAGIGKLLFG